MEQVLRDKIFYEVSSGGVTASGGEPLQQAEFVAAFFEECHEEGINTALDTSGYGEQDLFKKVLANTDIVLFDLKEMDSEMHKQFTGRDNSIILKNLKVANELAVRVILRIPLIFGYNDRDKNIYEVASLAKRLRSVERVELLPYNKLCEHKQLRGNQSSSVGTSMGIFDNNSVKRVYEMIKTISAKEVCVLGQ
jgi:pyruvate formate lyase activating enzyme